MLDTILTPLNRVIPILVRKNRKSVHLQAEKEGNLRKIEQWRLKLDSVDEEVDGIVLQNAEKERQEVEEVMKQEEKAKVFKSTKRSKQSFPA